MFNLTRVHEWKKRAFFSLSNPADITDRYEIEVRKNVYLLSNKWMRGMEWLDAGSCYYVTIAAVAGVCDCR